MLTDMMKDELVKGLLNLFHENLSMIILYGSVARNEATSESDIDIAIITKNDMNEEINLFAGQQRWIYVMISFFLSLILKKKI